MLRHLLKLTRWLSIPIFLICLAIAFRNAFIGGNFDIFIFGRSPQWHCTILIGLFGTASEGGLYEPGHGPAFGIGTGTGSFYYHTAAHHAPLFLFANDPNHDIIVMHDWYLFGWSTYFLGGATKQSHYWIHLPYVPLIALLASSAILIHWRRQTLKLRRQNRQGLCPTCSYDLRAHHTGQRCPECGTPISCHPPKSL